MQPSSPLYRIFWKRMIRWAKAILGWLSAGAMFSLLAMFAFIKIAHEMAEDETRQADFAVFHYFQVHQTPSLHRIMTAISWIAGGHAQPFVCLLLVVCISRWRRFWPEGATMLIAGIGGIGVVSGLKHLFHRPRPDVIFSNLGYSFPSGHSFFALVIYSLLAYELACPLPPRRKIWVWSTAITAILLVGFSRIYLGEHFLSDVAAGYAVGIPWLWGCVALTRRLASHSETSKLVAGPEPLEIS